ncbi:NAD-dependent epimerase/dehydratase family protein [Budvicia diplopodorum]|uniref:NAD-dependent epimerase/dehydratase family protein n=1 Tax=Budvicia diplopodorum TaxID=1119056 RepID=UPI001356A4E1|nr:NAD(P)-dependent oxidoreductase [Budvicia diplopodorum]
MTILVTGATHGLGRNAVNYLKQQGTDVIATGRDLHRGAQLQQQDISFIPADLSQLSQLQSDALLAQVDTVWHCAALSSPWGKYDDFYAANVIATRNLANQAGERGIKRFVHISTPSIYFNFCHHVNIAEDYLPERLVNHYAHTKWLAEQEIQRAVVQYPDTTFVILRPRALFGPEDRVLIPRILSLIKQRNGVLPLPRGGETLMDMTFVMNAVQAMWLATDCAGIDSGSAYNITNQQPVALKQVIEQLLSRLNIEYRIKPLPYWILSRLAGSMELWSQYSHREPAFTRYSMGALNFDMTLDSTKARQELGYIPRYSIDDGIDLTVRWIKENGV